MTELPTSWIRAPLEDVVTFNPKHGPTVRDDLAVSFVPMAAVSDIEGEIETLQERPYGEIKKGYTHFQSGDVIFAKITPCMENGKIAVARRLTNGLACGTTEFHVLRPTSCIDADFLWRFLRQRSFRVDAERSMTGAVGQRRVSADYLKQTVFPLPPLAEQRRIVTKANSLSTKSKGAREHLEHVARLVDKYKQAVLAAAFQGLLTEGWRSSHKTRPVRPRNSRDIRAKFAEVGHFEEPYVLPLNWQWLRLPELGDLDRGKSRHRPRNDSALFGGPYPFIQTGEVRAANRFIESFTETYSDFGLQQSRLWPQGTVCITIAANIAETAILGLEACFPDSVVGFVSDLDKANASYVEFFLRTARSDLEAFAPATAQKNINLDTLGAVRLPVAPLNEQDEVVHRIEHAFNWIDRLAREATSARKLIDHLDQAILAKAFRGELVPQDPNDEPASMLLDRIRAQRAGTQSKPRRKKRKSPN